MLRCFGRCLIAALLVLALAVPAFAQTRGDANTPSSTPGGQNTPSSTSPPGGRDGGKGGDSRPGGGSTGGLPDAVSILEILWGLPQRPGISVDPGEVPPDRGPKPLSEGSNDDAPPPRRPSRVVTLNPAQPFVPRTKPRAAEAPPAVTGAVVPAIREREVIVALNADATADTVYELSQDLALDGDTLYTSNLLGTRVVRFRIPDARSVGDVVAQLSGDARVRVAQPHYVFTANGAVGQPLPVPQYAPKALHLDKAHKVASGKRVKIAVIDTAIDTTHPAFGGAVSATFDALGSKGEAEVHGTSVASIAAARESLVGVAPAANVLGIRAFAAEDGGTAESYSLAILKGLDWAVLNGARVVNMSFAGPDDPLLGEAIAAAVEQGVTIVAAAGNGGPDAPPAYPGAFPEVIAVTAVDDGEGLYQQANRGSYIAIAAPGVDIVGAAPKGAYDISSGTSMAAAHISGIVALMLEKNPKMSPKEIREALAKSARQKGARDEMGAGLADAVGALDAL